MSHHDIHVLNRPNQNHNMETLERVYSLITGLGASISNLSVVTEYGSCSMTEQCECDIIAIDSVVLCELAINIHYQFRLYCMHKY